MPGTSDDWLDLWLWSSLKIGYWDFEKVVTTKIEFYNFLVKKNFKYVIEYILTEIS